MMNSKYLAISAFALLTVLNACGDDSSSVSSSDGEMSSSSGTIVSEKPSSSSSEEKKSKSSSSAVKETISSSSADKETVSSSSEKNVVPILEFKEDFRSECTIGEIPTTYSNAKLPNPFETLAGTKITTKDEWKCRREEIGAMYEKIMLGDKPRNPERVEGSLSEDIFTVTVNDKGKTVSFSVKISGAGTKDKPKPAMIGFGDPSGDVCGNLDASLDGLDIAQIIFNPDNVALESQRGKGKFYDIYGSNAEAGAIMAWAWGVSRLIDALENYPEAGIDVKRLGITGCSRWGKGALAVGAFDTRIALTIPQESGSGGASLWRVGAQVNKQKGKQFVQGLNNVATEYSWMKTTFKNYDGKENTLPFDQHMLVAMVAPRPLLIIDNAGLEWLGEVPSNYCGQASKEVYDALGVSENYTYSQEGNHTHCTLPNGQYDEVKDFINKFLVGKSGIKTGKIDYTEIVELKSNPWDKSKWIDWETPTLK